MHMKRAQKEISPSGNKKWVYIFLFSIFLLPFLPSPLSSLFFPPSFLLLLLLSLPRSSPSFFLQRGCIDPIFKNTGFGGKTVRTSRRMWLDTKTEPWAVAGDLCHLLRCNHAGSDPSPPLCAERGLHTAACKASTRNRTPGLSVEMLSVWSGMGGKCSIRDFKKQGCFYGKSYICIYAYYICAIRCNNLELCITLENTDLGAGEQELPDGTKSEGVSEPSGRVTWRTTVVLLERTWETLACCFRKGPRARTDLGPTASPASHCEAWSGSCTLSEVCFLLWEMVEWEVTVFFSIHCSFLGWECLDLFKVITQPHSLGDPGLTLSTRAGKQGLHLTSMQPLLFSILGAQGAVHDSSLSRERRP